MNESRRIAKYLSKVEGLKPDIATNFNLLISRSTEHKEVINYCMGVVKSLEESNEELKARLQIQKSESDKLLKLERDRVDKLVTILASKLGSFDY